MGMDIVRSKIEEISGTVEVDSTLGKGTTFTIKLPLTLAILPSLMSVIDGDVFALPVESIMEIVSVDRSDLCTVHGSPTAVIRGRVVSVVELSELFTWSRPPVQITERDPDECTLVVLGQEGKEIGLRVDVLLGEEDVVIKSMAENYRNVAGIAGASILGDGRVSLILDVAALIAMSSRQVAPV
jgi:two-component system chemotaxis sensor kinase CheA